MEGKNWYSTGIQIFLDTTRSHAHPLENVKAWQRKLIKNINDDISIPTKIRKNYNGNLLTRIKINETGNASCSFLAKSLYHDMDDLILHHFSKTPQWIPGIIHGCFVITSFKLSIVYQDGKITGIYKFNPTDLES